MLLFILQWLSLHWEILIMLLSKLPLTFKETHKDSQRDTLFHRIVYDYSCAEWDHPFYHLREVSWEDSFKLSDSAVASEFCGWVQVGIDVFIPNCKYQVKPYSSPWFSAACAAAVVNRNHFFHL